MSTNTVDEFFAGKPETRPLFEAVAERIAGCGPSELEVKTQISFRVKRKFAWFWLYNVTKKNPSGVLHLMLALDETVDDPHVRDVTQIGKNRWHHQIVIRGMDDATSDWLGDLIEKAYAYGSR
jgi:hypothetical protein